MTLVLYTLNFNPDPSEGSGTGVKVGPKLPHTSFLAQGHATKVLLVEVVTEKTPFTVVHQYTSN